MNEGLFPPVADNQQLPPMPTAHRQVPPLHQLKPEDLIELD